jgi:predicted ArsR family transcriptional regulator
MSTPGTLETDLAGLAALVDPVRRRTYVHVAQQGEAVGRDAVANAVGISRSLAAFHLERLAAVGLLDVEFRRLTGRSGPGAGRPAKLYRRSSRPIELSVPPRRHARLAGLLAQAIAAGDDVRAELRSLARANGESLGRAARRSAARNAKVALLEAGAAVLGAEGFEAHIQEGEIRLGNCPFDEVAQEHRPLICGEVNRSMIEGFAAGLGPLFVARMEPRPGACCMVVAPK